MTMLRRQAILVLAITLFSSPSCCDYEAITKEFGAEAVSHCIQNCPYQNRTDAGHYEMVCGAACNIGKCSTGCQLWRQGLDSSCQIVCNVSAEAGDVASHKELYCVMGCNEALDHYFQKLKDVIGTPAAPALVADSLTSTSLSLAWEGPKYSNLSYLVQWRYEEVAGAWQFCRNQSWGEYSTVHVNNLQPYTKYRFRVAVLLSRRQTSVSPVVSQASVVISTLSAGRPRSRATGLRAAAIDAHRISVSWEPGQFPNGPVLSYVLRIGDGKPNGYLALKDIPASDNTLFYIFQNLSPSKTYTVAVAMKNVEGEGPQASIEVSTPDLPTVAVTSQQPILILGGDHTVLQQAADMLAAPIVLYTTENSIAGLAIDVRSELLLVSESNSGVWRSALGGSRGTREPLLEAHQGWRTSALTIDWLNRHLYVLCESTTHDTQWRVLRSDYRGRGQLLAYEGFASGPLHIQVDPYNGYLFWVSREGLHRLDLADLADPVHSAWPECILKDSLLGAFVVDHTNFRVLVSHLKRNTVLSVSLDGREIVDFRNNTQKPMFQSVKSLALANDLFYWTNGADVLTEEYHSGQNNYFHNAYPDLSDEHFTTVLVAAHSCQPIPVPVNPPFDLQAVLGTTYAKVSWQPPHLLGHQGNGAWQHWRYNLQITDMHNQTTLRTGITDRSSLTVKDLRENAQYVIRVAAVTVSGAGPWSSEFVGKTLSSSPSVLHSSILWSAKEGLLQTNLTGDNVQLLISKDSLKVDTHISAISYFRDKLYLLTNDSTVMWYNRTSGRRGWMPAMDNVASLAVDWLGKRLYWSNPKQQLITRGNLNGSNREPVPIVTVAKELMIDSLAGHIYWNTGHAVECARLNGEHKITYYPAELFSGKQVMGLAMDLEVKSVYWIVRSYEGSNLYKAPTADVLTYGEEKRSNYLVESASMGAALGPLCHFSGRLLWLRDASRAVITNLAGKHPAALDIEHMAPVNVVAVVDATLHSLADEMNAIPEAMNTSSIKINGRWDAFNISWEPARSVTHGDVFYVVTVDFSGQNHIERRVQSASVEVTSASAPYTRVQVTVRAHTYWGSGAAAQATLRSPPGLPTRPTRPRLFENNSHDHGDKQVVFRWAPPAHSNGEIRGYRVYCGPAEAELHACGETPRTEYNATNLLTDGTYFFQVRAFTDAGEGPLSEKVTTRPDMESPIPTLLVSTYDSVQTVDLDLAVMTQTTSRSSARPVDVAVSVKDSLIYWLSDMQEIFVSKMSEMKQTKVTSINGTGVSICLDWVSRALYWVQGEMEGVEGGEAGHAVYRLQLDGGGVRKVLERNARMYSLNVNPSTRSLYWIEKNQHNLGILMRSRTNGEDVRSVFSGEGCECVWGESAGESLSLDWSGSGGGLVWVDAREHHIVASDLDGCACRVLLNSTRFTNAGLPASALTVDSNYIYWLNESQKTIYYIDKINTTPNIFSVQIASGQKIFAVGSRIQPMSWLECLSPRQVPLRVTLAASTATSLQLALPDVERYPTCEQFDMATPHYTIYYRPHEQGVDLPCDESRCSVIETYDTDVTVSGLEPFSNYSFSLKVDNYYGVARNIEPVLGPAVVLRTAAEAPSAAAGVRGVVLSPRAAYVQWQPVTEHATPATLAHVSYEVHWRTEDALVPGQKLKEHMMLVTHINTTRASLSRLQAGQEYAVWVRSVSRDAAPGQHADSVPITLRTYREPGNITALLVQAYRIRVSWLPYTDIHVQQHSIEFSELNSESWQKALEEERTDVVNYVARGLKPHTHYKFRVNVQYIEEAPHYLWPQDTRFTYQTLGDVPAAPGRPQLQRVSAVVFKLQWIPAAPHGSRVKLYSVWGRTSLAYRQKIEASTNMTSHKTEYTPQVGGADDWKMLHNVTEPYWIMSNLNLSERYTFYVEALNDYGWSNFSEPSQEFEFGAATTTTGTVASQHESFGIILGIGIPLLAALTVSVLSAFICVLRQDGKKKSMTSIGMSVSMSAGRACAPDVELATLRELPRGPLPHSTNVLYDAHAGHAELAALPHIRRDQITLTKFLGAGAFGEVFQGKANSLDFQLDDARVAVKTLRKGATEQEKSEFLQEAQLMSNFKHEHIMRLLGVCLDNDPNFIIMELMEDGDLLSYLRANRTSLSSPSPSPSSSLSLLDLLSMCLDVTRGCRYLEEMHFVHRDLAARNCLVTHRPRGRVVKIGDFGLARDIYNNDYYRKEGEGLLPVRWMAVECLMDGVFSCQSDVWAWGVLCWEVLSLGQQPYPARNNHQVLAYVRQGGKLGRPPNCPDLLFELLQECWSYRPDERPTFLHCLQVMQQLHDSIAPHVTLLASLPSALSLPHHYLTLIPDDVGYNSIENQDMRQCLKTPKHLKQVSNDNHRSTTCSQGYEIPRPATDARTSARHSIAGMSHAGHAHSPSHLSRAASLRVRASPHPRSELISHTRNILNRQIILNNNREFTSRHNVNILSSAADENDRHCVARPMTLNNNCDIEPSNLYNDRDSLNECDRLLVNGQIGDDNPRPALGHSQVEPGLE